MRVFGVLSAVIYRRWARVTLLLVGVMMFALTILELRGLMASDRSLTLQDLRHSMGLFFISCYISFAIAAPFSAVHTMWCLRADGLLHALMSGGFGPRRLRRCLIFQGLSAGVTTSMFWRLGHQFRSQETYQLSVSENFWIWRSSWPSQAIRFDTSSLNLQVVPQSEAALVHAAETTVSFMGNIYIILILTLIVLIAGQIGMLRPARIAFANHATMIGCVGLIVLFYLASPVLAISLALLVAVVLDRRIALRGAMEAS